VLAVVGAGAVPFAGAGVEVLVFALAATGLADVASAGAVATSVFAAGTRAGFAALGGVAVLAAGAEPEVVAEAVLAEAGVGAGAVDADAAGAEAVGAGFVDAGTGDVVAEGEVETTTVDDFTREVVQLPDVVVLGDGAAATGVLEEGAEATGGFEDGAVEAGAVVELPAVDDTFEPAGAAGDGAGDACLAAVTVVSRAVTVVS